jgi:uncharacterized membrane protein YfcA
MQWPDFPLAFYPVAVVAILLTGISKGGFGAGAGGLAVPIMSIIIAPPEAAGIMLPILCAMDIFGVYAWRGQASAEHLRILVPGAIAGIALGALAFGTLPVNAIRLIIGLIAVIFAVNMGFGLSERLAKRLAAESRPPGRSAGTFWGALSGFTSTLAHAGGPPFAVYILPQNIDKTAIVATSAVFFFVVNYVKLVPYYFLGQLNAANLSASLLFAPLAPLGVWLGVWLHRRISDRTFYRVSYLLLFATGAKLIFDAVRVP